MRMKQIVEPEFIRPATVEQMFGISIKTLEWRRAVGNGPPYQKVGRAVLYPVAGMREWIVSQLNKEVA